MRYEDIARNEKQIPWGPIGRQVYLRTYSLTKSDGTKETWPETIKRVVDGNVGLVDPKFLEPGEREKLLDMMANFEILPAGRHLYASGVKGRQFLMNCHAAGWDEDAPGDHFTFTFDELMMGGGVGSNYSNRYLESVPKVCHSIDLHVVCREDHPNYQEFEHLLSKHNGSTLHFTTPDSREGWVQSVKQLCDLAWSSDGFPLSEKSITIDVSEIRERGAHLKTSGGIACGPGPLVQLLVDFARQLNSMVGRKVTTHDCMVLDHHIAEGVVAGGKRRSSRISVKNWKDADIFDFINIKREDGAHWTTNISVEVDNEFFYAYKHNDEHARKVMRAVVLGKRLNGEPGIWNRSLSMEGEREPEAMFCPNPCGEIGLHQWEACNLGHVNMEAFAKGRIQEMYEAFRLMARWLIRATFSDIPQPRQRKVVDANRRIGVGFVGYHAWIALNGIKYSESWKSMWVKDKLASCHMAVRVEAKKYAEQLGIPVPAKNTALAPNGTGVLLIGTTASGQAMIAPWYKRLVRYSSMDPELQVKKNEGYECFTDPDARNTEIITYWCEDPLVAKVRASGFDVEELEGQYEVPFEDSLRVQAMLQEQYADNAVSFTVNLLPEKMPGETAMEETLMLLLPRLKGTTIFVDRSRKNAPIQPVTKAQFDSYAGRKETLQVEEECRGGCPIK
jgi:ribonucleoside-triphosphate reductase (thioredoxin)